jgi:hypothetical protein
MLCMMHAFISIMVALPNSLERTLMWELGVLYRVSCKAKLVCSCWHPVVQLLSCYTCRGVSAVLLLSCCTQQACTGNCAECGRGVSTLLVRQHRS